MPNPGNTEPGSTAGQLDVQQQSSVQFSGAIPIKKRRFPIFQPVSPSPEEKPSGSDANDSKKKQESDIILDGKLSLNDVKNTSSPSNSDVNKTSAVIVKNGEGTPSNIELGQSNAAVLASKPQVAKTLISLSSTGDLKNKRDVMMNVKHTEPRVLESSNSAQMATVKQEIISARVEGAPRLELSMASMNVELSLGTKETLFHVRSEKSVLTSSSLPSSAERLALHDNNTTGSVSSGVNANRSNWDLNTTMDVWGGSVIGDAVACEPVYTGGFNDAKLTLDSGIVGLSLNKGEHVLDSSSSVQSGHHYKTDDSLGLKLAMPSRELLCHMDRPSSDRHAPTIVSPQVNLPQARQSAMNVNRSVKSEPIDENSKHNCSIGSCSSGNMGLSKVSSVKSELVNNLSLKTPLPPSTSQGKSVDHRSIKSEVVEGNQNAGKCKDSIMPQSVGQVMQHQDSCASSSALPLPPMPDPCHSTLPTSSELTKNDDLSNQSEHSFQSKESHDDNDKTDDRFAGMGSKPVIQDDHQPTSGNVGNSNLEAPGKCKLARIGEHAIELCQSGDVTANDEEKVNIPAGILEGDPFPFGSDSESQEMDIDEENVGNKEYEEYEDGEVREPSKQNPVEGKAKNSELVDHNSQNPRYHDEPSSDMIKDRVSIDYESNNKDSTSERVSDKVTELGVDEKKSISVASDRQLDTSGKNVVERSPGKMVSDNAPIKSSHAMMVALAHEATDKVIKEICSGENNSTLSKEEGCLNDFDAKDSNNTGNKSRIINLSRTSVLASPSKTRYIPNRLLTSRTGKEKYSDLDADIQPRTNRDEFYIGGSKKFVKDRIHDRPFRNSFMRGKGRVSGRFGSMRREWNSDHDFVSENYRGPTDYSVIRRKSNVDLDCSSYGVPHDGSALGSSGRRKEINDEFPSMRRTSLRRISPGHRDSCTDARGIQMLRRIPRNMSPSRCADEDCPDIIGVRHSNKFMRHLSDDMMDPVFSRQQPVYDELDGQLVRGNRNFPIMHGNGYLRMGGSKSPVRSRTRSPRPWSSPRRRSPNGPPPENMYRIGRMRSPFRDEMMTRRRGSPPYPARHPNESRDMDSGREHGPHRSANSHRRISPGRSFPRNPRRGDVLDSQEMGEGSNEYINGPLHPNKFHGEGSSDERRNFVERRGPPIRSFRPMYGGDNDDFQFHQNDGGPRPFRFYPDMDNEFIERNSNTRGREFDGGRVKHHQPMMQSRRIRNIDEQATMEGGAWHEDGYTDNRMKRIRF